MKSRVFHFDYWKNWIKRKPELRSEVLHIPSIREDENRYYKVWYKLYHAIRRHAEKKLKNATRVELNKLAMDMADKFVVKSFKHRGIEMPFLDSND